MQTGRTKRLTFSIGLALAISMLLLALPRVKGGPASAVDPGPRGGPPGAGGPLKGLTTNQTDFFNAGLSQFVEIEAVPSPSPGDGGLGPRFNAESCGQCHAQPATGGTSPSVNPQATIAYDMGALNTLPYFISSVGPVREARFPFTLDANGHETNIPDGSVHDLFVITGRSDAPSGCSIAQPAFSQYEEQNDIAFRIPTPLFGAGLIEAIPNSAITAQISQNTSLKQQLNIMGYPNISGNDGTITRFGWKAQNKSLLMFAGEAYNVEIGVTNELMPNEREEDPRCATNPLPEDMTALDEAATGSNLLSDVNAFELYTKMLAPPAPSTANIKNCPGPPSVQPSCSASVANGQAQFNSVGCVLCHVTSFTTGPNNVAALSNKPVSLFSDLLLHHMGGLCDYVVQGAALGDTFRTAPLWGVGQRLFFLHDGRVADLMTAILDHNTPGNGCPASEAQKVTQNFQALSAANQQDILNFLRSL
jgi:CxxC motif-containing protein (DUF1111 family)